MSKKKKNLSAIKVFKKEGGGTGEVWSCSQIQCLFFYLPLLFTLTVNCLLLTVYRLLLTVYFLLFSVYCLMFTVNCPVYFLLFTVKCLIIYHLPNSQLLTETEIETVCTANEWLTLPQLARNNISRMYTKSVACKNKIILYLHKWVKLIKMDLMRKCDHLKEEEKTWALITLTLKWVRLKPNTFSVWLLPPEQ